MRTELGFGVSWAERLQDANTHIKKLEVDLKIAEASAALHAGLNRRAAKALGKPTVGTGSSWHDIPEWIETLRARCINRHERLLQKIARQEKEITALLSENERLRIQVDFQKEQDA